GETEITSSVARLQLEFGENVNRWDAIQRGALKFIDADLPNFKFSELFDLEKDPGEKRDLAEEKAEAAAELAALLKKARGGEELRPAVEVDDETRRALKSLGYMQ
ncbi:MAG: hypothetical protein ACYTAN_16465, partial [Planctomycetota bacterium]